MAVSDYDRVVNQNIASTEADMAALKEIYNCLSPARQKLLEKLLEKLVICTHLFAQVLPSGRIATFMLDFAQHRRILVKDLHDNPLSWPLSLVELFAKPNRPILLPQAYLAVRMWNCGEFYAPANPAKWNNDPLYPVHESEMTGTLQEIAERLVARANEPLGIEGDLMAVPKVRDEDDLLPGPEDSCD